MVLIHTVGYYSALIKKKILTHATAQMNLEKIKLSEISHLQRTNSELPRIANSWIQDVEWWVPGVARRGELLFNGYRVSVL